MIGVYILFYNKKIIYIGQTTKWPKRLQGHSDLKFTEAKIFECRKDDLNEYEKRFIQIFGSKLNINGQRKSKRLLVNEWILEHAEVIERSILLDDTKFISLKAKNDLGYSRMTSTTDIMWTIHRRYEKIFNKTFIRKRNKWILSQNN